MNAQEWELNVQGSECKESKLDVHQSELNVL